ncbi:MAG: hypothetical protein H8K03_01150 [Nitrospira sp.]
MQFLRLQSLESINTLILKHDFAIPGSGLSSYELESVILQATDHQIRNLLDEVLRTQNTLRFDVSPRYRFDERFKDLKLCLLLDGLQVEGSQLIQVEPTVDGADQPEDALSRELKSSGLPNREDIIRVLTNSAEAFRKSPPDFNGCLSNARVALQTLATDIAKGRRVRYPGSFDENLWGQVLAYLRTSDLISKREEDGLSGVFTFVSPGAHSPVGLDEAEMTRLGRSLIVSMCYFLVKRHNGS